jgi:ABC-type amino acid transport substrate-binding protein
MKLSNLMSIVVATCALLTACDEKKDGSGKTLTIGVSADYAPFEYFKEGEIIGFDIDLMKEIAKRLSKEVTFKDMSFDAILGSLATARIDAAISSITPTNERRKSVDFSKDYIKSNHVMICKATSSIHGVSDLAESTVGVQAGSTHETYAKEALTKDVDVTVKSLSKIPDLLQDMENGNVNCLILGGAEGEAIKASKPNIKILGLPGEVTGAAIAFPKGSPLTAKVDKVLDEMEADGSLAKLKEHWLPHASSSEVTPSPTSQAPLESKPVASS